MLNRKLGALLVSSMLILGACTVTNNPSGTDGTDNGSNSDNNSGDNTTAAGSTSLTINGENKEFAEDAKVSISSTFVKIEQDVKMAEAEGGKAMFSVNFQSRQSDLDPKDLDTSKLYAIEGVFFPILVDGKVEIKSYRAVISSNPSFEFEIKREGNNLVGFVTRTKEPTMEYKFNVAMP